MRHSRVPVRHRREVAAVGLRIAAAGNNRQLARVPERFEARHRWMQPYIIGESERVLRLDRERWPELVIRVLAVGHDRV